jgi:hypothetical protein
MFTFKSFSCSLRRRLTFAFFFITAAASPVHAVSCRVVAPHAPSEADEANMEISGFIGITALGQMTVSIDYRDGLMKFAYDPNRGFRYGR